MKRFSILGILTFLLLSLLSCREMRPSFAILSGNYAVRQGRYHKAILRYLKAESGMGEEVVLYNLANVYYALGEGEAALDSWHRAEKITQDKKTLFRIYFNRGVLYYQWGRFREAYLAFWQALLLEPASRDAKINLELALSRIPANPGLSPSLPSGESEGAREEDSFRLLEYIKRKETSAWPSQEDVPSNAVDDW